MSLIEITELALSYILSDLSITNECLEQCKFKKCQLVKEMIPENITAVTPFQNEVMHFKPVVILSDKLESV